MTVSFTVRALVCAMVFLVGHGIGYSQSASDDLSLFISAGRVSHMTGTAQVRPGTDGPVRPLTAGEVIAVGDLVETGANCQLEVLLEPGSFLRVTGTAEFQIVSTNKPNLRILIRRGSAVIETGAARNLESRIRIETPSGMAFIETAGLYRVNVKPNESEFATVIGTMPLGSRKVVIAPGQRVIVNGDGAGPIGQFDAKKMSDPLYAWSRERAAALAKANRRLDKKSFGAALDRFAAGDGLIRAIYGGAGFWALSQAQDRVYFVPFYPTKWRSPYGFEYTYGQDRLPSDNPRFSTIYIVPRRVWGPVPSGRPIITGPNAPKNQQPPRPPGF